MTGRATTTSAAKYRTIVIDPPWPYPEGFANGGTNHTIKGRKREPHERGPIAIKPMPYPSLTLEEIGNLPVPSLAAVDARLFLWATNRYLPDAVRLIVRWGFKYRQLIVWDKTPNIPPLGGSVARNAAEYLLVAQRGTPGRLAVWPSSVVRARKPRTEHSRKPDVFLDIIESVSPEPRLELFARRNRLGWSTWGNESLEHEIVA